MERRIFMFFKKVKKRISFLLLILSMPVSVFAYSQYLIPGGDNIGIELRAKGVMIVGTYKIGEYDPTSTGLQVGDIITEIENQKVSDIEEMVQKIDASRAESVKVTYLRNNVSKDAVLKLYKEQDVYKTGLYVKDRIVGVGTLTFIDPNSKTFGALGHEIIEKTTGQILEIKDGQIFHTNVTGIDASTNGNPGEKNASFDRENMLGNVFENTTQGVFGTYFSSLPSRKQYKVASPSDIEEGKAKILTVIEGKNIAEYDIMITQINKDSKKNKNFVFEITDTKLLEKTGGIVQGMSGSPILQGDFIIGAVTHVVVDNPSKGYGIFIENMLKEAEN